MTDAGHKFRHWVEVRDLKDGSLRTLQLYKTVQLHIRKRPV